MKIGTGHLSYCTNIHAGESWSEIFKNLEIYILEVKSRTSPNVPFGIGLRLSNIAAEELSKKETLDNFKTWLKEHQLYVYTMNGFPFGSFHGEVIKDQVHAPDWTHISRKNYTKQLFDILGELLPESLTGGISTSAISYKFGYNNSSELEKAKTQACSAIIDVVIHLMDIKSKTGKTLHLDIEPEPDGIIENSNEFVAFYNEFLIKKGISELQTLKECTRAEAELAIREHVQLCFDICHSAVAFEKTSEVISLMNTHKIKIGKLQLSSALKCHIDGNYTLEELQDHLLAFHEPNYLHQAIIKTKNAEFRKFIDLDVAIEAMQSATFQGLRTHYHVPIFLADYQKLQSTQDDLIEVLKLWKDNAFTNHLEIETYTWDVLPDQMQTDITTVVIREMEWVLNQIN